MMMLVALVIMRKIFYLVFLCPSLVLLVAHLSFVPVAVALVAFARLNDLHAHPTELTAAGDTGVDCFHVLCMGVASTAHVWTGSIFFNVDTCIENAIPHQPCCSQITRRTPAVSQFSIFFLSAEMKCRER